MIRLSPIVAFKFPAAPSSITCMVFNNVYGFHLLSGSRGSNDVLSTIITSKKCFSRYWSWAQCYVAVRVSMSRDRWLLALDKINHVVQNRATGMRHYRLFIILFYLQLMNPRRLLMVHPVLRLMSPWYKRAAVKLQLSNYSKISIAINKIVSETTLLLCLL